MEDNNQPRKEPKVFPEQPSSQGNLYPPEIIRSRPHATNKNSYFSVMLIMVMVINLVASYFIVTKFAPSITTVDVIAGQVNTQEALLNTEDTGLVARLENVINSLGSYAKKTDLSAFALNSTVSGFITESRVAELIETAYSTIQSDLAAATATITELESLVAAMDDLEPVAQGYDVSVLPTVIGGNLSLSCVSPIVRTVAFEITFIRSGGTGTPTLNTPAPISTVSGADIFTFVTPVTTIPVGNSAKQLTYTAVGGWVITVKVVNVAITGTSTIW